MKKYIATIEALAPGYKDFKAFYDSESGIIFGEFADGSTEEISDMQSTDATDRELVEEIYAMYNNSQGWIIDDCIEYED